MASVFNVDDKANVPTLPEKLISSPAALVIPRPRDTVAVVGAPVMVRSSLELLPASVRVEKLPKLIVAAVIAPEVIVPAEPDASTVIVAFSAAVMLKAASVAVRRSITLVA